MLRNNKKRIAVGEKNFKMCWAMEKKRDNVVDEKE